MSAEPTAEASSVLATDAGLFAVWDPYAFDMVVDYDTWAEELLEDADLIRHIHSGALAPVNIDSDGAFQFLIRVGAAEPAELTQREQRYLEVRSEPYRFLSQGQASLSGIEAIGDDDPEVLGVPLPAGEWSVTVCLIDWAAEPGSRDDDGEPTDDALPDFIVLINPAGEQGIDYRQAVQTFER